uniref:AAA family ATPase n=1 Tax=Rhodococcus sp. R1101 TaxID=1170698 RepID=UPI0012F652EF
EPRSLILIDEPESHLHPSLLSALMKALSAVLEQYDSYAIIATHSPVVLQEIPRKYVRILKRFGAQTRVDEPLEETFGENIGILTASAFNLDSSQSDYHSVLEKLASTYTLDEIEELFDGEMSVQARAYVRAIIRQASR